uniref:Small ribosomal subunit protein uS10m n=1 Tax=Meloidogyne floridensis TaxID=298350 RepID=A0A915NQJ4_9BILA
MLAATAVNTAVFSTLLFNRNLLQTSTKLLVNQNNLKIASVRNLAAESAARNLEHDKLFKRIDLELRGHDPEVLSSYTTFVSNVCDHLEIEKSQVTETPHLKWLLTTLKDKFAKKKYKVQYETITSNSTANSSPQSLQ